MGQKTATAGHAGGADTYVPQKSLRVDAVSRKSFAETSRSQAYEQQKLHIGDHDVAIRGVQFSCRFVSEAG